MFNIFSRKRFIITEDNRRGTDADRWVVTERSQTIEFEVPCGTTIRVEPKTLRKLVEASEKILRAFDKKDI